ncbi:MAG: hypothetical protein Q9M09_01465 [Mariprofundaceae bacterium]|nr:hypothetical protein [Mariprofundaceae bacterium]
MKNILTIAAFTVRELLGFRVTRTLFAITALLPLLAWAFSQLFMLEIAKVQLDVMVGGAYLLGVVFLLSTVVTLLGKDIGEQVCYFFLPPPIERYSYVLGRFLGSVVVLTLLYTLLLVGVELLIWISLQYDTSIHRHGINWIAGIMIGWTAWYQTISLMGAVFLICAWATGVAEMLVFSSSAAFIYWVFPPILAGMKGRSDADPLVSESLKQSLDGLSWFFPDMTGGSIVLAFEHGISISNIVIMQHALGHLGYTALMLGLAIIIFSKRSL